MKIVFEFFKVALKRAGSYGFLRLKVVHVTLCGV